jgi:hypothetical protein
MREREWLPNDARCVDMKQATAMRQLDNRGAGGAATEDPFSRKSWESPREADSDQAAEPSEAAGGEADDAEAAQLLPSPPAGTHPETKTPCLLAARAASASSNASTVISTSSPVRLLAPVTRYIRPPRRVPMTVLFFLKRAGTFFRRFAGVTFTVRHRVRKVFSLE